MSYADELNWRPATELARLIRSKAISPVEARFFVVAVLPVMIVVIGCENGATRGKVGLQIPRATTCGRRS